MLFCRVAAFGVAHLLAIQDGTLGLSCRRRARRPEGAFAAAPHDTNCYCRLLLRRFSYRSDSRESALLLPRPTPTMHHGAQGVLPYKRY